MSEKIGFLILGLGVVLLGAGVSQVSAETITSPSYKIDGNFGGSFGGQTSSTSYKMTAIGGEAIVGSGASGSYIIDQQQSSASVQSMQLGVQPSGLVGFYPMDENAGTTTADTSRYQNDGALSGGATWHLSGKLGSAVDMNSVGQISIPDHPNLPSGQAMTIEAWLNQDAILADKAIAGHWFHANGGPTNDPSWSFGVDANDGLIMYVANGQADIGNNYAFISDSSWNNANVWRHVVAVYDGTLPQAERVKFYIDGVQRAADVAGALPSSLRNSAADFSIGSLPGYGDNMNGSIDHVKLFNRALTSTEIAAEYTAQNAGISTGLALGTAANESKTSLVDAIVRTNVSGYNLAIQQDHDLQNGANTIPAISGGSIASPLTWSDGVTKGLGFTLVNAPNLDSKWGSGVSYAALPSSATTFYTNTGHVSSNVDVINARLRLDTDTPQVPGSYTNNITYTGTMIP